MLTKDVESVGKAGDIKEPIKTLGEHQVPLRLHREVTAHVNLIVTQDR